MSTYKIVIPTHKRAEHLLNKKGNNTLRYIGPAMRDRTYIAIREEEEPEYLRVAERFGVGMNHLFLKEEEGIPETRDVILEEASKEGWEHLIMIDDDLKFATRSLGNKYTTFDEEGQEFGKMIMELMVQCDEGVPLVGITARQFSNDKPSYSGNTRIIQLLCFHMPTIVSTGLTFTGSGMRYMTDYYFTLSLLQCGYRNLCLNTYTRDDIAQFPGGCSVRRTVDLYNESARKLKKHFPDLVRLEWKTGGTWKAPRITPYVSWKKAFRRSENETG